MCHTAVNLADSSWLLLRLKGFLLINAFPHVLNVEMVGNDVLQYSVIEAM